MSHKNNHSVFAFLRKSGVISAIIVALIFVAAYKFIGTKQDTVNIDQVIYNQFKVSKEAVIDSINTCLNQGKVTQQAVNERREARVELMHLVKSHHKAIPANAYLLLTQYIHFDGAEATQPLCHFNEKQLKQMKGKLTDVDIKIRTELGP